MERFFDRHGYAVERAKRIAAALSGVGLLGSASGMVEQRHNQRVEPAVHLLHARDVRLDHFTRRELAGGNGPGQFGGAQSCWFGRQWRRARRRRFILWGGAHDEPGVRVQGGFSWEAKNPRRMLLAQDHRLAHPDHGRQPAFVTA